MNPLLFVFNPRNIERCVDSIQRLPIDQCWLTGYREWELDTHINRVIAATDYTHYLCCSDDGIIPPFALDAVLATLDGGHDVATGYSNIDHRDMRVNLTRRPFELNWSDAQDYDLYHLHDVLFHDGEILRTWFAGFALTGMTRDLWLEFPFISDGAPSDWRLSRRLQDADVPIVAHQAAFMWHDKEQANQPNRGPERQLLVGRVEPAVTIRPRARAAA